MQRLFRQVQAPKSVVAQHEAFVARRLSDVLIDRLPRKSASLHLAIRDEAVLHAIAGVRTVEHLIETLERDPGLAAAARRRWGNGIRDRSLSTVEAARAFVTTVFQIWYEGCAGSKDASDDTPASGPRTAVMPPAQA